MVALTKLYYIDRKMGAKLRSVLEEPLTGGVDDIRSLI